MFSSSGLNYYRHADWLGSSRFASTTARAKYYDGAYAPFGEPYSESGTADRSFTGDNQDTVSGLYDFTHREHSPVQGRWISPDPASTAAFNLRTPQSLNRYVYVSNNPLNTTDPTGLCDPDFEYCDDPGGGDGGFGGGDGGFGGGGMPGSDGGETNGIPTGLPIHNPGLLGAILPDLPRQCDFGPCGDPGFGFQAPGVLSNEEKQLFSFSKTLSDCYNGAHEGAVGKAVEFFSILSLDPVDTTYQDRRKETGTIGAIKAIGFKGTLLAIKNFGSATAKQASKLIGDGVEVLYAGANVMGTAVDGGVYGVCSVLGAGATFGPPSPF